MDATLYDDDPERVRGRLQRATPGEWIVFETFAADGSLAIGVAQGGPDSSLLLVVYDNLAKSEASAAAQGLARWHRGQGRSITLDCSKSQTG